MAAQVRIVFTPVLNALKSGLAQAKNMIQGVLTPLQKPVGPFGGSPFGFVAGAAAGQFSGLRDEILKTIDQYRQLQYQVNNWGLSAKNAKKVTAALQAQMEAASDALARKFLPNFKQVEAALRAAGYQGGVFGATTEQINRALNKAGKSLTTVFTAGLIKFGKTLSNTGRRMSWFAFRLIMFGRMFQRMLMSPIKKGLRVFQTWDRSITEIATSMGFLAASGMLTADMQGTMLDVMGDLPSMGMQVQGMLGAMAMLFGQIGRDVIPALIPPIVDLIGVLSKLWSDNRSTLIPIFERIGDLISNRLIPLFEESGAAMIEGLAKGVEIGIGALVWLMEVLKPHLPLIAKFIGIIAGAAPIFIALGSAIFIGATALAGLGMIFGALGKIVGIVKFVIIALGTAISILGAPITAIILILAALGLAWATNFGNIRGIVKGFFDWFGGIARAFFEWFGAAARGFIDWFGGIAKGFFERFATILAGIGEKVKGFFEWFGGAAKGFFEWFGGIVKGFFDWFGGILAGIGENVKGFFALFGGAVKGFFDWFSNIFEKIGNILGGIGKKVKEFFALFGRGKSQVKGFKDSHDALMDDLNEAYQDSIGKDMARQYDIAGSELADLMKTYDDFGMVHRKVMADLDEPVAGQVIQNWADVNARPPGNAIQNIEISIEFSGDISADTDVDAFVDEISRKLAEKIEYIG